MMQGKMGFSIKKVPCGHAWASLLVNYRPYSRPCLCHSVIFNQCYSYNFCLRSISISNGHKPCGFFLKRNRKSYAKFNSIQAPQEFFFWFFYGQIRIQHGKMVRIINIPMKKTSILQDTGRSINQVKLALQLFSGKKDLGKKRFR
jgi:hypothetical protein